MYITYAKLKQNRKAQILSLDLYLDNQIPLSSNFKYTVTTPVYTYK